MADPEVEASFLILVLGPETEVLFLIHNICIRCLDPGTLCGDKELTCLQDGSWVLLVAS